MKPAQQSNIKHSALLLASGALAGSLTTLALQHLAVLGNPLSRAAVSAQEAKKSPARESALNRRAGDTQIKLGQILSADDPAHKSEDLRRLGAEAGAEDPAKALKMASGIAGEADRLEFNRGVFEAWGANDPKAAADYAKQNFSPGGMQAETLTVVMGRWGAANARDGYAWAEANLSGPLKEEAVNSLVQSWTRQSPEEAAGWFVQTGSTSQPLLTALAGAWASTRPLEAAKWVETLPEKTNRDTGRVIVAQEWVKQEPDVAAKHYTEAVNEPPPAGSKTAPGVDLATAISDIWGTNNPVATSQWVESLKPGQGREEAAGTLATVWAASDIQGAVKWSESLGDPVLRAQVVQHLGTTWGAIEPDKALAWLATQPAELRTDAVKGAYNSWAGTDPKGLNDWITSQPAAAPDMDVARRSLADIYAAQDPLAAIDLANGMASPSERVDAISRYFRQWRKVDDAGAQDWLRTNWNTLPPAAQDKLRIVQKITLPQ